MPCKRKRTTVRFPPARIKKIMQKDEEIGKVAASVPVIISRTLELFLESFLKKTHTYAKEHNAKTLSAEHIKGVINCEEIYKFLLPLMENVKIESEENTHSEDKPVRDTSVKGTAKRGRPKKFKTEDSIDSKDIGESDNDSIAGPSNCDQNEIIQPENVKKEDTDCDEKKDLFKTIDMKTISKDMEEQYIDKEEQFDDKEKQYNDNDKDIDDDNVDCKKDNQESLNIESSNKLDLKNTNINNTNENELIVDIKESIDIKSEENVLLQKYSTDFRERKLKLSRVPSFSNMHNEIKPETASESVITTEASQNSIETPPTTSLASNNLSEKLTSTPEDIYLTPSSLASKAEDAKPIISMQSKASAFTSNIPSSKPHSLPFKMSFSNELPNLVYKSPMNDTTHSLASPLPINIDSQMKPFVMDPQREPIAHHPLLALQRETSLPHHLMRSNPSTVHRPLPLRNPALLQRPLAQHLPLNNNNPVISTDMSIQTCYTRPTERRHNEQMYTDTPNLEPVHPMNYTHDIRHHRYSLDGSGTYPHNELPTNLSMKTHEQFHDPSFALDLTTQKNFNSPEGNTLLNRSEELRISFNDDKTSHFHEMPLEKKYFYSQEKNL